MKLCGRDACTWIALGNDSVVHVAAVVNSDAIEYLFIVLKIHVTTATVATVNA